MFSKLAVLSAFLLCTHAAPTRPNSTTPAHAPCLGSASNFTLLIQGATTVGPNTIVHGNAGVQAGPPSGFAQVPGPGSHPTYELSPLVTQQFYDETYSSSVINRATYDGQQAASSVGMNQTATFTNYMGGQLSGLTLQPGYYLFTEAVTIALDVYLNGTEDSVIIIETTAALTIAASVNIYVLNGMQPQNIYWKIDGAYTVGAKACSQGYVFVQAAISLGAMASHIGELIGAITFTGGAFVSLYPPSYTGNCTGIPFTTNSTSPIPPTVCVVGPPAAAGTRSSTTIIDTATVYTTYTPPATSTPVYRTTTTTTVEDFASAYTTTVEGVVETGVARYTRTYVPSSPSPASGSLSSGAPATPTATAVVVDASAGASGSAASSGFVTSIMTSASVVA